MRVGGSQGNCPPTAAAAACLSAASPRLPPAVFFCWLALCRRFNPAVFWRGRLPWFLVLSLTCLPPTSVPARAARLLSARWLPAVDEGAAFGWLVLEAAVVRSLQLVASPRPQPRSTWLTVDATPALRAHCATLQPIFPLSSAEVESAGLLSEWPSPVMLAAVGPPVCSPTYLAVPERSSSTGAPDVFSGAAVSERASGPM